MGVLAFVGGFLTAVGVSQATNVLRLAATQMKGDYQEYFGNFGWASPANFTDGSYADNWYAVGGPWMISFKLDRLYDLSAFQYGDNTNPDGGRVGTNALAAGSGVERIYTDTSTVSNGAVTPMTGTIGRRGGYIRWRAVSVNDYIAGGSELEVEGTATRYVRLPNPGIQSYYPEYSPNYAVTKIFDNSLYYGGEYASLYGGTNTYIVFDFGGSTTVVSAVEIWDRNAPSGIKSATLVFSDDLTFGDAGDITVSYSKTADDPASLIDLVALGHGDGIKKRYMKWQVTELDMDGNVGMAEIGFFQFVPEPGPLIIVE